MDRKQETDKLNQSISWYLTIPLNCNKCFHNIQAWPLPIGMINVQNKTVIADLIMKMDP